MSIRPRIAAALRHSEDRLIGKGLLPGHNQYRKFVIVTRARTGSNLLVSLLNSHPHVEAQGEVFREMKRQSVESRLDQVFRRRPRRIKAVGFKMFYYHPRDGDHAQVWQTLGEVQDLSVIHLKRRNVLRTLTSRKLAARTNIWFQRGRNVPASDPAVVRFTPEGLEEAFERNEAWEASCEERFRNHELLQIYYEDLVDRPALLTDVTEFLGVRHHAMSTSLRKQHPEHLAALISNFDELQHHFEGSRWAPFFDDR